MPHRDAATRSSAVAGSLDAGLRAHMNAVYGTMAAGLGLTGVTAWAVRSLSLTDVPNAHPFAGSFLTDFGVGFFQSPFVFVAMFAPLAVVFLMSFRIGSMSAASARSWFLVFAMLNGLSLSSVFMVYDLGSVTQAFFLTAASFGAMSLWGYTTDRDLSGWGSFLFMGLFGLILAMVVNLFLGSPAVDFAVSAVGVLLFAGLTAYDTQRLKEIYYEGDGVDAAGRKVAMGALELYLDFVNMFLFLLRFVGVNVGRD